MKDFKNFQHLKVKEKNFVLEITLNRPEKKNAIGSIMLDELMKCTKYANKNNLIRAVVYRATGNIFCSGLDLYDFKESNNSNSLSEIAINRQRGRVCSGSHQ